MTLEPRSVWLDAQGAQNRAHFDRGIPRYVNEQLRHVVGLAPAAIAGVGINPALALTGNLDWLLGSGRLSWDGGRGLPPSPRPRVFHAMSPIELGRALDEVWPRWARGGEVRTVVTLFDLIPLVFADHYLRDPTLKARYLARLELVRSADQVLALSRTTADDAARLLGVHEDRLTVIDAGVSNAFAEAYGSAEEARRIVRRRFDVLRPGFMLYVAGIEYRKNIERLIQGYGLTSPAFRARHQLVITCRTLPEERERLLRSAEDADLRDGELILTGYVTDAELAALYRTCELFVFASFYEGSGLPMLEAMACGAPVVASNTSTSPEILAGTEGTFNPFVPADIARVLEATLADAEVMKRLRWRSRERVARYTWRRVAEQTLRGYERALAQPAPGGGGRRGRAGRRARIGFFTPWPPDRSGIASYNLRLATELGKLADLDVVVGGPLESYPEPQEFGVRVLHADDVSRKGPLVAHDRLVYCMGNSAFHGYVYEAMRQQRGVVVAHDVRLTGFYGWYSGQERPEDPAGRLHERIEAMYGARVDAAAFSQRAPTPTEQASLGIHMTHELQEYAERLVVHSEYAAEILRLDVPSRAGRPPDIVVLPLAFHERPERRARQPDPASPLVVTFGVVSSVKNPQVLIEALAMICGERPGARLVFAGGGDAIELERWRQVADDAGVGPAVDFLGHVDEATWERLLAEADVAVQLRLVSNGEASATVCDCLSAGLPVIVTDQGWFGELPDAAVEKVAQELTAPVLAGAIGRIIEDRDGTAAMITAGREFAAANSFRAVARRYLEVLELA